MQWAYQLRYFSVNLDLLQSPKCDLHQILYFLVLGFLCDGLQVLDGSSCNYAVINGQETELNQSTATYTRRENARRAGVTAGIPKDRVQITVHKIGQEIRFGWKESLPLAKKATTTAVQAAPKSEALGDERNGLKRPKAGGVCAAVWDWLDRHPTAKISDAKAEALERGWNLNNVVCEFYRRRKFYDQGEQQGAASR